MSIAITAVTTAWGFNRTILECKANMADEVDETDNRFNRTILECKERKNADGSNL